jgi:hypothetical protein
LIPESATLDVPTDRDGRPLSFAAAMQVQSRQRMMARPRVLLDPAADDHDHHGHGHETVASASALADFEEELLRQAIAASLSLANGPSNAEETPRSLADTEAALIVDVSEHEPAAPADAIPADAVPADAVPADAVPDAAVVVSADTPAVAAAAPAGAPVDASSTDALPADVALAEAAPAEAAPAEAHADAVLASSMVDEEEAMLQAAIRMSLAEQQQARS